MPLKTVNLWNYKFFDVKKDKYIMDCVFSSWKNISEIILNADVVCCDVNSKVLRIECEA